MFIAKLFIFSTLGLVCGTVIASAAPDLQCPMPLEKGMQWTYEGKAEWTASNSAAVLSTNIHWVMEVVNVLNKGGVRASIVRGFPNELAWYEPDHMPGISVLLSVSNRIYHIPADSEKDAESLAQRLMNATYELSPCAEEWLVFPLAKGQRWGGDVDRKDNNYWWYVEGEKLKDVGVESHSGRHLATAWTLTYRTNPDHQIMEIVAGLGITRYVYSHHGTVASVDVQLVSFGTLSGTRHEPQANH